MLPRHRWLTCAMLLLSACASRAPEFEADWRHGAKHAWVVAVDAPTAGSPHLPACLARLSETEMATRRFVTVRYWHVRQAYFTIAELPGTLHLAVGDEVELWPEDCDQGEMPRISRKLVSNPG